MFIRDYGENISSSCALLGVSSGSSYGIIFNDPTKRMAITTIIKNPDTTYTTKSSLIP